MQNETQKAVERKISFVDLSGLICWCENMDWMASQAILIQTKTICEFDIQEIKLQMVLQVMIDVYSHNSL